MEETQPQSYESLAHRHRHSVESIITLLEWLLVAFILALLFQGFAMQAFQIPTGSMAETLRGAHYHLRCLRCGCAFDVGSESTGFVQPRCANCGYLQPPYAAGNLKNGDRIFVLKSIYQFFEPKRWDVVVFKNPTNPKDNYIKRLIALPHETVQLINGDVFINGKVARKPANVQKELWMPVFLQDYPPIRGTEHFNAAVAQEQNTQSRPWVMPFQNEPNSAWNLEDAVFTLGDTPQQRHTLIYTSANPYDFHAVYSYNDGSDSDKPIVSDLMLGFYAKNKDMDGYVGASLEKYGVRYSGRIEFRGAMVLSKTVDGVTTDLRSPMLIGPVPPGHFEKFEFACVDQLLVLRWGQRRVAYDLSNDPEFFLQEAALEKPPQVRIFAAGSIQIRHIGLFRDIYYIGKEGYDVLRATEKTPFKLQEDQFFVCGDNCNNSLDGRLWIAEGIGNNDRTYDAGIVPLDYMMGKAVLVYWSQAFQPARNLPPLIPNLGTIKAISGGSEQQY